jgi:carboxyl-terminal processing protease
VQAPAVDPDGARPRRWSPWFASHGAAVVLGAALAVGALAEAAPARRDRLAALDAFAQALSHIQTDYVDRRDERELLYAAIRGMLARLDPHSALYGPAAYRRLRQDTEGEFGGVGFELDGAAAGPPRVTRLLSGSPADRAGIREGDEVLAIDGVAASARRPGALRGPRGTRVELRLRRGGVELDRTLVREQLRLPSVRARSLGKGVGYLAIGRFHEATSADCAAAVGALAAAPGGLTALLLDLRGNRGGVFDQAIKVADLFLAEGVIATVWSRGIEVERHAARRPGTVTDVPMIVLVDQDSASAAELVAAALRDHGRATLLGAPTFGKGSVQTYFDLPDGGGLKLTTARYATPSGQLLDGRGLVPDLVVEAFAEERVVAGGGRRPASSPAPAADAGLGDLAPDVRELVADDPQLAAALRMARRGGRR